MLTYALAGREAARAAHLALPRLAPATYIRWDLVSTFPTIHHRLDQTSLHALKPPTPSSTGSFVSHLHPFSQARFVYCATPLVSLSLYIQLCLSSTL